MSAVAESIHKASFEYPYLAVGTNFDNGTLHFHEETELLYVAEGSILLTVGSENRHLVQGDICVILPGQTHTLTPVGPVRIQVMKLYPVINLIHLQPEKNVYSPHAPHYGFLLQNILTIIREDSARAPGFELAVLNACGSIMLYILRNLPKKQGKAVSGKKRKHDLSFLSEVNAWLEAHYLSPLSLEDISTHFGYSRAYFSRLFKEAAGTNFVDYCTVFKLKKSLPQLKNARTNIESVALASGFNNLRSYNRVFQKYFGQSPGAYRKQFHG